MLLDGKEEAQDRTRRKGGERSGSIGGKRRRKIGRGSRSLEATPQQAHEHAAHLQGDDHGRTGHVAVVTPLRRLRPSGQEPTAAALAKALVAVASANANKSTTAGQSRAPPQVPRRRVALLVADVAVRQSE